MEYPPAEIYPASVSIPTQPAEDAAPAVRTVPAWPTAISALRDSGDSLDVAVARRRRWDRFVGAGVALCGVLTGVSPLIVWYGRASFLESGRVAGVDAFEHRDALQVADASNLLVAAVDMDGWFESYFGPGFPVVLGVLLAVLGVGIAAGRVESIGVLGGLWLAVFSWAGAAYTDQGGDLWPGPFFALTGIALWGAAGFVAAVMLAGLLVVRRWPGPPRPVAVAWLAVACALAWVPLSAVLYELEDRSPFAAASIFVATVILCAAPAAALTLGFSVALRRPTRLAAGLPAGIGVLLGGSLLMLLSVSFDDGDAGVVPADYVPPEAGQAATLTTEVDEVDGAVIHIRGNGDCSFHDEENTYFSIMSESEITTWGLGPNVEWLAAQVYAVDEAASVSVGEREVTVLVSDVPDPAHPARDLPADSEAVEDIAGELRDKLGRYSVCG